MVWERGPSEAEGPSFGPELGVGQDLAAGLFAEAAAFLRELADVLERGKGIEMGISQQQIRLNPDEPVTLEISYREDPKKKKMEVELEIKEHFGGAAKGAGRPKVGPLH